jgi:hypothetical protein
MIFNSNVIYGADVRDIAGVKSILRFTHPADVRLILVAFF